MSLPDPDFDHVPASALTLCETPEAAADALQDIYERAAAAIAADFERFSAGKPPQHLHGAHYPYLCVNVADNHSSRLSTLAFGKVAQPGLQGSTITAPRLFRAYLIEQLSLITRNYTAQIYVGVSRTPIPLTFAVERATAQMDAEQRRETARVFPMPDLAATHDTLVDGVGWPAAGLPRPLSLFSAERVDYSLHRLRHYTATDPSHFQSFVLFTNYQRYVDEFVQYGLSEVRAGRAQRLVEPGDRITKSDGKPSRPLLAKQPQMPAYHLVQQDGMGVTLINIGVGPSNAKTATDHLAVLRPHAWLMVGHCGGLRATQRLGDYVLAHAYLRDDGVLDRALPLAIPLPTIAEVQLAMARAVTEVTGLKGQELKERFRTGTIVTTHDRNWELRFDELAIRFNQSRAIGIDMESATIAANGYRFRVPYGTLLCVSDRPLHGEIKLPGMADAFYEERVGQHLQIGLRALSFLRDEARAGTLHSRKLRSFTEPAFR